MKDVIKIKKPNQVSNVKVSHEASSFYADVSKQWAIKLDKPIENGEYSSKYYAKISEQNANSAIESANMAEEVVSNIEKLVDNTLIFPELKLGNEEVILNKLKEQKHTSFDKSKFTVIGSPVISTEGIISRFSNSDYIKCCNTVSAGSEIKVCGRFTTPQINPSTNAVIFHFGDNSTNKIWLLITPTNQLQYAVGAGVTRATSKKLELNTTYDFEAIWTNCKYLTLRYKKSSDRDFIAINTIQTAIIQGALEILIGGYNIGGSVSFTFTGSINLSRLSIKVDSKEVFNGNKTETDTITINNEEIEIPYTLSKTGSKIVDITYRDKVQNLYERVGYTHYYTLGEDNYTLATCKSSDIVAEGEVNGVVYTRTADLTLTQRGSCTNGTTVKLLPYKDKDSYQISTPYSEKTRNSFTPSATGDFIAIGKTVIE